MPTPCPTKRTAAAFNHMVSAPCILAHHPPLVSLPGPLPQHSGRKSPPRELTPTYPIWGHGSEKIHHRKKLCDSAKPPSTPHVWFAVIRPAEQPSLKMPFREKRPLQPPWHLPGAANGVASPCSTTLCSAPRFSFWFQLTANLTADTDGY